MKEETWRTSVAYARTRATEENRRMTIVGWKSVAGNWHYSVLTAGGLVHQRLLQERGERR